MRHLLTFVLIALLPITVAAQNRRSSKCTLSGRILEDSNNPAPGANVVPDYGPTKTWEDLIITARADDNGKFTFEYECSVQPKTLYVTSPLSFGNYTPFMPPFLRGKIAGLQFAGIPVPKQKGDINLGDIPIQVYYATVIVSFLDETGAPLFTNRGSWEGVWIRLRNEKGMVVTEGALT